MKALSVKHPWAEFIAQGVKLIETRTWRTSYRGQLLIVSSKTLDFDFERINPTTPIPPRLLPFGSALCVADLVDCRAMVWSDRYIAMCETDPGKWSWVLDNVRPVQPFPVRGKPGLFDVDFKLEDVA